MQYLLHLKPDKQEFTLYENDDYLEWNMWTKIKNHCVV